MGRNAKFVHVFCRLFQVALLTEGVGRNVDIDSTAEGAVKVALLTEGVGRNGYNFRT